MITFPEVIYIIGTRYTLSGLVKHTGSHFSCAVSVTHGWIYIDDPDDRCVSFGRFEMFAQNFGNGWSFGVYAASQCQLLNNVSGSGSSSSSAEFRNAPYAQVFVENISSVDFAVNRKSLKSNNYCNNQLKDKGQVISRKARKTKRKVEKNGSKPLEPNTKRDRKSEEIPLERKVLKERGTTFENISQPGNFDTSRRKIWSEVKVS